MRRPSWACASRVDSRFYGLMRRGPTGTQHRRGGWRHDSPARNEHQLTDPAAIDPDSATSPFPGWQRPVFRALGIRRFLFLKAASAERDPTPLFSYACRKRRQCSIHGRRLEAAIAFYTTHFGSRSARNAAPAFADIVRGPLRILLSGPKSSAGGRCRRTSTRTGADEPHPLLVEDIEAEVARLRAAGVSSGTTSSAVRAASRSCSTIRPVIPRNVPARRRWRSEGALVDFAFLLTSLIVVASPAQACSIRWLLGSHGDPGSVIQRWVHASASFPTLPRRPWASRRSCIPARSRSRASSTLALLPALQWASTVRDQAHSMWMRCWGPFADAGDRLRDRRQSPESKAVDLLLRSFRNSCEPTTPIDSRGCSD